MWTLNGNMELKVSETEAAVTVPPVTSHEVLPPKAGLVLFFPWSDFPHFPLSWWTLQCLSNKFFFAYLSYKKKKIWFIAKDSHVWEIRLQSPKHRSPTQQTFLHNLFASNDSGEALREENPSDTVLWHLCDHWHPGFQWENSLQTNLYSPITHSWRVTDNLCSDLLQKKNYNRQQHGKV